MREIAWLQQSSCKLAIYLQQFFNEGAGGPTRNTVSEVEVNSRFVTPSLKRSFGYILSALFASLFYVAWIFCELLRPSSLAGLTSRDLHGHFIEMFSVLILFLLFGGFGLVFLPLILPWTVAVSAFPKAKCSGKLYFSLLGAGLVFVIGCLMSSVMPKPLFIEDQTFFEGVLVAVKRQGICLALAGGVFGASYWFLCERHVVAARKTQSASLAS